MGSRRELALALALGVGLGAVTRFAYDLPGEWHWVAKVGVPWLAVGFAAGAAVRRPRAGALLGALALVTAVLVYYAIMGLYQDAYGRSPLGLWWLAVAVPGGLAFGGLGALWRSGRAPVLAPAAMGACFAGEALLFAFASPHSTGAVPVLAAAALLVPLALLPRANLLRGLSLTAALVGAAAFAEGAVFAATGYLG